jgi:hypothetical protein
MHLRLHANATTTPRTRAYIQQSQASTAALARELGIHPRTVARWKARADVADRSTTSPRRCGAASIPSCRAAPFTAASNGMTCPLA